MPEKPQDSRDQQMQRVNAALQILSSEELRKLISDLEDGVARYDRANMVIEAARASRSAAMSQFPLPDEQ